MTTSSAFDCCAQTWIYRSDDAGRTWTLKETWTGAAGERFGGLAHDPAEPDRVHVALAYGAGGVEASQDGGDTWTDLGRQDLGWITDLALGIGGRNLYAATDEGLLRLRLR